MVITTLFTILLATHELVIYAVGVIEPPKFQDIHLDIYTVSIVNNM